jgi:2-phospho-L-lactate/phosphoenolpyruvate guanylyltransferase
MMRTSTEGPSKIWAIVPVKRLSLAKQRLSPVLSRSERAELVRTMLHDVLTTLCATPDLAGIIVVSGDPMVAKLATLFDARVVGDVMETGVNAAVQQGLRTLEALSAGALILPADVPFATASDLQAVIGELGHYPMVLAPALSDGGTNALAMRQPNLITPSFGDGSFARHQALARDGDGGVGCGIVRTEGLGRDIDYPNDLARGAGSKKFSLTAALLAEFNVADRLGITQFPVSIRHM